MKKALSVAVVVLLLVPMIVTLQTLEAQSYQAITIKPDGSVEPDTNLLERNGTKYIFRDDLFGTIWVQTDNITIDGAGHSLQGNGIDTGQNTEIGILLGGPDLSRRECRTVQIENLRFYNVPRGIFSVGGSNNSIIGNYFDKSGISIQGNANNTGDLIEHNTFINALVGFDYNQNGTDIITENNFVNTTIFLGLSNAPIVDKNYWSDYTAKYPNAKELDNSGIWDTPYVYGTFQWVNSSIDGHPLVDPITDFEITGFGILNPTPTPSATPTMTPSDSPTRQPTPRAPSYVDPLDYSKLYIFFGIIALTIIIVVTSVVVYFKKYHRKK